MELTRICTLWSYETLSIYGKLILEIVFSNISPYLLCFGGTHRKQPWKVGDIYCNVSRVEIHATGLTPIVCRAAT